MDVRYVYAPGGTPLCTRCQQLKEPAIKSGPASAQNVYITVDGQIVCKDCLTEPEYRAHAERILQETRERMQENRRLPDTPEARAEFAKLLEQEERFEQILEDIDTNNDPAELRQFIANVESGVKLAESKGEPYEYPELIAKAQWARERLLLLSE